jgi:hypothetical protein
MKRRPVLPLVLLISAALPGGCVALGEGSPVPGVSAAGRFHQGMVFGLFSRREPGFIRANLSEIHGLGANAVSISIPWITPDVRSAEIFRRKDITPTDEALRQTIREAHRLGMSVFLMPLVFVDQMGEGEWRGTIQPPDWEDWFDVYGDILLHYARLAREENVAFLSVGSELCSTEGRREDWEGLIARVRRVYPGALTYSANWDHREPVSFAGALDYVGMNTYFELSRDPDAGQEELVRAWSPILEEIRAWRESLGKPLILTEVGYPSRRGSASNPWDYTAEGSPDPEAQARAYRAFLKAWTGFPALAGVYFYIWWGEGGPDHRGYTPRGKPAEEVLRDWFGRPQEGEGP